LPKVDPCLLSIDLGTTACKVTLFGLDGSRLAGCQTGYPLYSPEPGAAEQEPDDWRSAFHQALISLSNAVPQLMLAVTGIGLAAQMNAIVLVDNQFQPLGRAQSSMDQRSVPYNAHLRSQFAAQLPEIYFGRNGMLGRIAWLGDQLAQQFASR